MPTATPPPYGLVVELASGRLLLIERSWSAGELLFGLVIVAVVAVVGLHWLADLARGRR